LEGLVVAFDTETDLALIHVPDEALQQASIACSDSSVRHVDFVAALGTPLALESTTTSSTDRQVSNPL
jgi:S1-C subfamily serine protease